MRTVRQRHPRTTSSPTASPTTSCATSASIPEALYRRHGPVTTVVYYDEIALGRWIEEAIRAAGITVILGAVLRGVRLDGRRVKELDLATRYGDLRLSATGFVDATGDAALTWQAGFACRESASRQVYGTQMVVLENIDEASHPQRDEMAARMKEKGDAYQLVRRNAVSFVIPGRGIAVLNMTHTETPLEPLAAAKSQLEGKAQADRAVQFLKDEFPKCFGQSRVRAYGNPGIRQTRWIAAAISSPSTKSATAPSFPMRSVAPRGRSSCTTTAPVTSGRRFPRITCTISRSAA